MAPKRTGTHKPAQSTDTPDTDGGKTLTAIQRHAIEHLASGKTDHETADALGLSRSTVTRWRNWNPVFAEAERKAEDEAVARTRRRLRTLTARAVQALEEVLDGTVTKQDEDGNPFEVKADPQHRIAAAKTILDRAGVTEIKGVELTGAGGGPVAVDIDQARTLFRAALELTPEQRAAVRSSGEPS